MFFPAFDKLSIDCHCLKLKKHKIILGGLVYIPQNDESGS